MNASGTLRADFVRASRLSFHTGRISTIKNWPDFKAVDHVAYREKCEQERRQTAQVYDASHVENQPALINETGMTAVEKLQRMVTVFPYRDPTWLVAMLFAVGSTDFTINAFFTLLPLVAPETIFETEATLAVPATIFVGAFFFITAGLLDLFGAFNADRGRIEVAKGEYGEKSVHHTPALLGSREWVWTPGWERFIDILTKNKPFQSGLMQLAGGSFLTTSAFTGLLGLIDPADPIFPLAVFGPQVIGGSFFILANILLASCEQDKWWKPKPLSAGWQAAFQSALGGAGFTFSPLFLFQNRLLESAIATFIGSWFFLSGSLLGLYVTIEYC